jgi:subtilisin family serine protease
MRSARTLVGAWGATIGLVTAGLVATGLSAGAAPTTATAQEGAEGYVVAFDAAASDAAYTSISEAGGSVVDVNGELGYAQVEAGPTFAADVAGDAGIEGVAHDHSIGTAEQGQSHVVATDRLTATEGTGRAAGAGRGRPGRGPGVEPLSSLQWDMAMIGATPDGAHRRATGRGVQVGIIDTGVDATHPDIAPNFNHELSRNFTVDIPAIDGECADDPDGSCLDPADVDEGGHGTHVAGTVAAARNGIGISGVAPDAQIVNLRAGQDSGYFFMLPTINALTEAGDLGLDVVNMSFYTDPWLFNCASADDYVSGDVSEDELAEQALIRQAVLDAVTYAHDHGVTLVAAAGNGHFDYDAAERPDGSSPDFPPGAERDRVVTDNCLDLPTEAPEVISVSAVGPSTTKSDYSDYGDGHVEIAAPGGWFRDGIGTSTFRTNENQILSSYPRELAIEEGLIDPVTSQPIDGALTATVADCSVSPCAIYAWLQGTSMASPHVAGVAALVVEAHGRGNRNRGYSLAPDAVRQILLQTATDHACPAGGVEVYTDEGRTPDFNAACNGTTADNGLYGEGIVNATAAVARR